MRAAGPVIDEDRVSNVNNLRAPPGGGPSGMGMSSSVSSSSSSFEVPGGGPSGMRISSSVSSAYKRVNSKGSMSE